MLLQEERNISHEKEDCLSLNPPEYLQCIRLAIILRNTVSLSFKNFGNIVNSQNPEYPENQKNLEYFVYFLILNLLKYHHLLSIVNSLKYCQPNGLLSIHRNSLDSGDIIFFREYRQFQLILSNFGYIIIYRNIVNLSKYIQSPGTRNILICPKNYF